MQRNLQEQNKDKSQFYEVNSMEKDIMNWIEISNRDEVVCAFDVKFNLLSIYERQ